MRTLTDHLVKGAPAPELTITVLDEPGSGGANHEYLISADSLDNPVRIYFQNGPIKEAGVNGITHEALLAVIIDRLKSFQAGPYSSDLNAEALKHCKAALLALQVRTYERMKRGVEGTSQK
jgi:hypothetical protein